MNIFPFSRAALVTAWFLLSVLSIPGCGIKGPLTLPEKSASKENAAIVFAVTRDALVSMKREHAFALWEVI